MMAAGPTSWLQAVIGRVTLPGRPTDQHDPGLVERAGPFVDGVVNAAAAPTTAARVTAFTELITELDTARAAPEGPRHGDPAAIFELFAYQPADVLTHIAPTLEQGRRWSTLVEIYQAWVDLARAAQIPQVSPYGQRVALGYLIRTRWHLYAAAVDRPDPAWLDPYDRQRIGGPPQAATAARQSRDEWITILDNLEDNPLLARDIDPAAEAELIAGRCVTAATLAGDATGPSKVGHGDEVDAVVWRHAVRHHLLPRFMIGPAWQVAWRLSGPVTRTATGVAVVGFGLAVASTIAGFAGILTSGLLIGAGAAAAGYAAIVIAAMGERSTSWPWLLRQPASAGLGLLVLVTLGSDWWKRATPPDHHLEAIHTGMAVAAAGVLLAVGISYLTVEAVNHGVTNLTRNVAAVVAMAVLHAFLVTVIALSAILPAFAADGPAMAQCWTDRHCGSLAMPGWLIVAVATAWCFTAGVFTQVLWDDQPFTAPLAHTRWRTGR